MTVRTLVSHAAAALVLMHPNSGVAAELPTMMHAAAINPGEGISALSLHELPVPRPKSGDVLIAVQTAGVGVWQAKYLPAKGAGSTAPMILGSDGAGTIVALGSAVRGFTVGETVYGVGGAFYAQYASVPAEHVAPVPRGVTMREAGVLGISGLSALQGVEDVLKVKPHETLLIHGAAGSVGSLAVQFAKLHHVRVLATVTDEAGAEFVRRLGADAVINGKTQDIEAEARRFAPEGIDAVLGLAGGESLEHCINTLRSDGHGRVAYLYGMDSLPKPRYGIHMILYSYIVGPPQLARLNAAVAAAKLRVPVAAQYGLADAAQAHARLDQGHLQGKIVILTGARPAP